MGRELQKRKSLRKKTNPGSQRPEKAHKPQKKTRNLPLSNPYIAQHWDKSQTLAQNYARLGLARKLNGVTGGVEKKGDGISSAAVDEGGIANRGAHSLGVGSSIVGVKGAKVIPGEARIRRDKETGAILGVVEGDGEDNSVPFEALDDPLNQVEKAAKQKGEEVERDLPTEMMPKAAAAPRRRKQSEREREFLRKLVEKYGTGEADEDVFEKMRRDNGLNVMQLSAGDLKRRVKIYTKESGVGG